MTYICPICNYKGLFEPPYDACGTGSDEICPCCGFHFGLDDFPNKEEQIEDWRQKWENNGYRWFSNHRKPPNNWDGKQQLYMQKSNSS